MHLKKMGRTTGLHAATRAETRPAARTTKTLARSAISIAALAMASGLTACTRDYTIAFLYVTTSKSSPGVINQYTVDYQSGVPVQIGTPIATGLNPIASVASPNERFIYVVNQGDSTVQEFQAGSDGLLTSKNTYKVTGNKPTAIAIDPAGQFLYVTCTYQGANTTGAGALSVFPVGADNSLGSPININIGNNPVAVAIANFNPTVYVVDQDPVAPQVLAFTEGANGTLTPVAGSTVTTGFPAGVQPSAIAEDPTGRFVYVTDQAANQLIGYVVQNGGGLQAMVNGPFATGLFPVAVLVDPRGRYIYVANYNARTIGAYSLDVATGTPSGVAGSTVLSDPNPVSIALDPALGIYLYTANNLGNTITGEQLNPSTGSLGAMENSPFPASGNPTSVVVVSNGSHPTQALLH